MRGERDGNPVALSRGRVCGPVAGLGVLGILALAAGAAPAPRFRADVLPILQANCVACHADSVRQGRLDLRTPEAIRRGGRGGAVLDLGHPERSRLLQRIVDGSMPPGNARKLTPAEREQIRAWIATGALAEKDAAAAPADHWAFQAVQVPRVPAVRNREWVRNPVDAFVLRRLEARGLAAPPEADRRTLLRRVTLDLIGLPPTPQEQDAFLADRRPGAYERWVDHLLSRPEYGERWARRWLDVVRYAESNGYERDGAKPSAWRYRDYVIGSLNDDKPYDRFLIEQLAGDELPDATPDSRVATTFLRLGTWDDEPADPAVDRCDQLDDVLGVTASTFLGVTLRCARCHDHKFEPFTQRDYYRTLAIFSPLKRPQNGREDLDVTVAPDAEVGAYNIAVAEAQRRTAPDRAAMWELQLGVLARLVASGTQQPKEILAAFQIAPDRRSAAEAKLLTDRGGALERELRAAETPDEAGRHRDFDARIQAAQPTPPARGYIWQEEQGSIPATPLLFRGDPKHPREAVEPGVPAVLARRPLPPIRPTGKTSGRRLALAHWLASPDHPLTARVLVNRIWQGHFGEGLAPSENDFGVAGQRPTHPELLDWLAATFSSPEASDERRTARDGRRSDRRGGSDRSDAGTGAQPVGAGTRRKAQGEAVSSGPLAWSLKKLHRLLVTSSTYRAASPVAGSPAVEHLNGWRPRRLEAEVVRDAMLAVSGQLNSARGGPSVYPVLPRAVLEGQSRPGNGWGKSGPAEASRRSVYIFSKRTLAVPELEALDSPDSTSSCEQRLVSTTAPQALTFLNGEFATEQARRFAARVRRLSADPVRQVELAFRLALGRLPNAAERDHAVGYLRRGVRLPAPPPGGAGGSLTEAQSRQSTAVLPAAAGADTTAAALESLCLVLFNTNEFFYTF